MICTEQERAALMAAVMRHGNNRQDYGWASARGDAATTKPAMREADEAMAAIRAMLAPPDDAVLRERIREAVKDGMFVHKDRLKDGSVKEIIDSTADSVWAVLRGEATRDE